jgi:hypothetical protein
MGERSTPMRKALQETVDVRCVPEWPQRRRPTPTATDPTISAARIVGTLDVMVGCWIAETRPGNVLTVACRPEARPGPTTLDWYAEAG